MLSRKITSAIGHIIHLDVDQHHITLSRGDPARAPQVHLDRLGVQILIAYLGSTIEISPSVRPAEQLGDERGTIYEAKTDPAPLIAIHQDQNRFEISAPSWAALKYELELLLPRLEFGFRNQLH